MSATEQGGAIFKLIPQIMQRVGAIGKDRKALNASGKPMYAFRGIDDIYNACQPVMAELGVFIVPEVIEKEYSERESRGGGTLFYTRLHVKHTFYAADGSNVVAVTIGEAMDSGDKSANKAMSAAMKYAMIETFSIPTEEFNDTENETHQPLPQRQQQAPPPRQAPPARARKRATWRRRSQVREVKELLNIVRLNRARLISGSPRLALTFGRTCLPRRSASASTSSGRLPGGLSSPHPPPAQREASDRTSLRC
jgi:hypothetical protein